MITRASVIRGGLSGVLLSDCMKIVFVCVLTLRICMQCVFYIDE